jgi:regulator of RNase E activity RraA
MTAPLSADELAALRAYSTPTVCNAIERFGVRPRNQGFMDGTIVCRFPELGPMAGYAVTAKVRAAQPPEREAPFAAVWDKFEKTPRPWVVVIEDLDYPQPVGSYWGEVNASVYKRLGAVGCVTNGGVRDLGDVRPHGFHFFSSCLLVSHAYMHVVEAGTPVSVGGLVVRPGDLLHGDEHGVTTVPHEIARELPDACRQLEAAERKLIGYASSAESTLEGLREMYPKVD